MRGRDERIGSLFSYVDPEARVATNHPLRTIRLLVNEASGADFSALYSGMGRPSIHAVSQRIRKRIEEAFGWIKTVAVQAKTRFRGHQRVGLAFAFAATACNPVRLPS